MNCIKIRDLEIKYGEKIVISGFSADIPIGNRTCIMGESGCGKTSLLNVILGLIKPTCGSVSGVPEKISAVFQEDRLSDEHTVFSNAGMATKKSKEEINEVIYGLGLSDVSDKKVKNLSGGQKRRTAIARALLADFDLLVLDEAFSSLDAETKATVSEFIAAKTVGKTVISVTHDNEEPLLTDAGIIKIGS
mgnify:FL=1